MKKEEFEKAFAEAKASDFNMELVKQWNEAGNQNTIEATGDLTIRSIIAMEELAECSQAISKSLRKEDFRTNLIEEIADVYSMLYHVMRKHNITEEDIQKARLVKMKRDLDRWSKDK